MNDFVLNVRQLAQYPPIGAVPAGFSILVQNGLGGPYYSTTAATLVATALSQGGGSLGVGMVPPADALAGQTFAGNIAVGYDAGIYWNAYPSTTVNVSNRLTNGDAGALGFDANIGWQFSYAEPGAAGSPVAEWQRQLTITPSGYLEVADQIAVSHDPTEPLEVATMQFVDAADAETFRRVAALWNGAIHTFNGRSGDVILSLDDVLGAGGAPIFSPRFLGCPAADTPPPWSHSGLLATTAFVHRNSVGYIDCLLKTHPFVFTFNGRTGNVELTADDVQLAEAALLDSPPLTGTPTAPTAPPGTDTTQLATTAFVNAAINSRLQNEPGTFFAPTQSPIFNGVPQGPTAAPGTNTGQLATTAFVMAAVQESVSGVVSFNTRTGIVELEAADITAAGGALLASPHFTGTPTAPMAAVNDTSNQVATTGWVMAELGGATVGVMSFNGRSGAIQLNMTDITTAGGVGSVSPNLTGIPTAPTAATGTSSTQIATTAFVAAAITAQAGVSSFNTRTGAVTLNSADISAAGGAPSASPTLTGTPLAPTASLGTSTQQIATTAFVAAAVAAGAGVVSFNTRQGAVTLTSADVNAPAAGGPYLSVATANTRQNRNRLDNGDFRISQFQSWMPPATGIGQAASIPQSTVFTDRWSMYAAQANILSVQLASLAGVGVANGGNCLQFYSNAAYAPAAGDVSQLAQSVEFTNMRDWQFGTSAALPLTVSFIARASVSGTFGVSFVSGGAAGGLPPYRCYVTTFTLAAGVWTPVVITIPGDGAAGSGMWNRPDGDQMVGFTLRFDLGSGATYQTATPNTWQTGNYLTTPTATKFSNMGGNAYIALTNIQLETGGQATPFDWRPLNEEFSNCRRYYQTGNVQLAGVAGGNGLYAVSFPLTPVMRGVPDMLQLGVTSNVGASGLALYGTWADTGQLAFSTVGGPGSVYNVNIYWAAVAQI